MLSFANSSLLSHNTALLLGLDRMFSVSRRSHRQVSSTATRVYQVLEWILIFAIHLGQSHDDGLVRMRGKSSTSRFVPWIMSAYQSLEFRLVDVWQWQLLLIVTVSFVIFVYEARAKWLSLLLYVVIFPMSVARKKCLDGQFSFDGATMFANNLQISAISYLHAFLPYFHPFGNWTPDPNVSIQYLGYLLSPHTPHTATLHLQILNLGRDLVGSSLNAVELSLSSQALTAFTVYYLDKQDREKEIPFQETFLFAFLWGLFLAVLPAIPFLSKNVRLAKIKPHHRPKNITKQRYMCAIYAYISIAFVVLTLVRSFLAHQLSSDPFIFLGSYLVEAPVRLALALYWAFITASGIIVVIYFWGSKPVGGLSGFPNSAMRLLRRSSMSTHPHEEEENDDDDDNDIFFEGEDTLAQRARALDRRRKFFHGLVVVLFLPTLNHEAALSYLALSLALAAFIFEEILRATVLPPFGMAIHKFLSGFTDHRDKTGHLVVSHLFLLIGVATPVWLTMTGESKAGSNGNIAMLSGVLTLGAGDAAASIIGKKFGRHKWPQSKKSIEGTMAFILAMMMGGFITQQIYTNHAPGAFDWKRFSWSVVATGLMEAVSTENDNLIIPVFMWCLIYKA